MRMKCWEFPMQRAWSGESGCCSDGRAVLALALSAICSCSYPLVESLLLTFTAFKCMI